MTAATAWSLAESRGVLKNIGAVHSSAEINLDGLVVDSQRRLMTSDRGIGSSVSDSRRFSTLLFRDSSHAVAVDVRSSLLQ